MPQDRRWRALPLGAAALYLLVVIYWSIGIGFNAAPDEYSHFFLVEYILRYGSLPHQWIDPTVPFRGLASGAPYHARVFWYYGLPNPHALGAAVIAHGWITNAGLPASPLAVRAFNWLLSIPFFLSLASIARRGARLASPEAEYPATTLLAGVIVAAIPQVVFIFAYFNSDAFGLTALAAALALLLRLLEKPGVRGAIACGAVLCIALCAKIYFLPAIALFGLIAASFVARRRDWPVRSSMAWCLGTALLVAAPILVATWAWYGDASGMQGQRDFARLYGDDAKFMKGTCFVLCRSGWVDPPMLWWWSSLSFKSFFYSLGWLDIVLPVRAYQLFFLPLCIGLIAACVAVVRGERRTRGRGQTVAVVGFWALLLLLILANLLGSQRLLPQPQGRYLYAVLPFIPLLIGFALGRPTTGRIVRGLLPCCVVAMLAFDAVGARAVRTAVPHSVESSPGFVGSALRSGGFDNLLHAP